MKSYAPMLLCHGSSIAYKLGLCRYHLIVHDHKLYTEMFAEIFEFRDVFS